MPAVCCSPLLGRLLFDFRKFLAFHTSDLAARENSSGGRIPPGIHSNLMRWEANHFRMSLRIRGQPARKLESQAGLSEYDYHEVVLEIDLGNRAFQPQALPVLRERFGVGDAMGPGSKVEPGSD